jgi:hypothetical protein
MQSACALLYCHIWPAPLYTIFPHYLINCTIFEKVIGHKMCVLISSKIFVWNISYSKTKWARYDQKCILVFMYSTRYSCNILIKIYFFWKIFEKYSYIKFYENASSGSRVLPCRQTDGRTDGQKDERREERTWGI